MEFGYLGALEARIGDAPVALRRGLPQALLAALLVHRDQPLRSELLVDWLWPGQTRANATNGLQVQISYLRRTLGLSPDTGTRPALVTASGGYALMVEAGSVDVDRFAAAIDVDAAAGERSPERRLEELTAALALWRGEPLADVPDAPYVAPEVARLTELRLRMEEARNDALLELGRHEAAIGPLQRAVRDHPFRERLHAQLATALYRSDRQADALRSLDDARRALRDELGVDPSPALQELQAGILRQDPGLRATPPGAPGIARPEPSATTAPTLPAATGRLLGRGDVLRAVEDLLVEHRCVTITGPGGAGKTSVAIEAARRLGARSPVWFVELAAVRDPGMLTTAIAEQVGASLSASVEPVDAISAAIGGHVVLVLDNCEHLADAAAHFASTLLHRSSDVRIITTSRSRLAITGEMTLPLPPLDVPAQRAAPEDIADSAAVQLFVERARAVRPDFRLDAGNATTVAAICRLVDGLPLAIELAAARVSLLAPEGILRRLDAGADLLSGGVRDRDARQRSITAAIAWSYELLDSDGQRMFDRLSVFHGRSPIEAAIEVAGTGLQDPLSTLDLLVNQSLVVSDGHDIRLLEPLRAFAAQQLAQRPAEEHGTRHTHARWFRRHPASDLGATGPDAPPVAPPSSDPARQLELLNALRGSVPNLRAALSWSFVHEPPLAVELAVNLTWFWLIEGASAEALQWLERAVGVDGAAPGMRGWALRGVAVHAASVGDLPLAGARSREAIDEFRRDGDQRGEGEALLQLGTVQWAQGDLAAAASTHDRAVAIFADAGILWAEAMARFLRARTAVDAGEPDALSRLTEAEHVARRSGRMQLVGVISELAAKVAYDQGDLALADQLSSDALRLQESVGYLEGVASALQSRALVLSASGEHQEAVRTSQRGLRISLDIDHPAAAAEGSEVLAAALLAGGGATRDAAWLLGVADDLRHARQLTVPAAHASRIAPTRRALEDQTVTEPTSDPPELRLSRWLADHATPA